MRAFAIAIALLAASVTARAAEIDAFISTAIKAATDELLSPFERANGHVIRASYAPSGALIPRFIAGEPVDVFLTDSTAIDALIKQGRIVGGRTDLARTGIGIAVRKAPPGRRVVARSTQACAARGEEHSARSARGRQHHRGAYPGRVPAARDCRAGHAEGQARSRRSQRPRQRAGLERRGRDRLAAGLELMSIRGRGDRHAAGGAATDHALLGWRDSERKAS